MIYYVYIYYDPRKINLEPIYIGKGKGNRFIHHLTKKTNPILKRKLDKIKKLNLEPIIIKHTENLTNDAACELESILIKFYGRIDLNSGTLCNLTDGGEGASGRIVSEKTKKLWSYQRKGKKQTPAQYQANLNRICTDEHRNKISESQKGIKRLTKEQYKKIANKRKGTKMSVTSRNKMSQQRKGKKQTPAQYQANLNRIPKTKKVQCINNNIIYNSAKDAANDLNLKKSSITSVANGAKPSIKGYKFIYVS